MKYIIPGKNVKKLLTATMAVGALTLGALTVGALGGCAVARDQSTAGEYVDDAAITAQVKARFVESKAVAASSITVETLQGVVQLSGFATTAAEKASAENIAKGVKGVKSVKNSIIVKS